MKEEGNQKGRSSKTIGCTKFHKQLILLPTNHMGPQLKNKQKQTDHFVDRKPCVIQNHQTMEKTQLLNEYFHGNVWKV